MADGKINRYKIGNDKMKKMVKTLALSMAVMLISGCGTSETTEKTEEVWDETEVTQEVTEEPTAEPTEEPTAEPTDAAEEDPEKESENDPKTETENQTAEKKTEKEIKIPHVSSVAADYTTVEGLQLEPGSRIAFVVKNTEANFWKAVKQGISQAVNELNKELGYEGDDKIIFTYEGPKTETNVNEQVNILDAVISENPTLICLAAVDEKSCVAQLEAANENEIPVIILDSGLSNEELVNSICATSNFEAGREAARKLCEAIGMSGEVAVLSHGQLGETSKERVEGFQQEIAENYPNVTIAEITYEPVKEDELSVEEQVQAVLDAHPDLKGYFSTNEIMGEKLLKVLDGYADRNLQVVGFDLGKTQKQAIKDGKMIGVVSQDPHSMGYVTVIAGVRAVLGMENDKVIDTGYRWLDASNLELEENQNYIYE